MHEFNLKMIKLMTVALMAAAVLGIVSGVRVLRDNYYWKTQFFVMQADFLKEQLAFIRYEHGSFASWLADSKRGTDVVPDRDQSAAGSIPILLYHGVIDDPNWQPDGVNMRLDDFRAQMFALKHAGYRTVTLEEYMDFMLRKRELPERSIMLTFDDARKDSYYPVDPIFRVLGYSAVMNVITGRSLASDSEKSSFHLSRTELLKMVQGGRWEMASHTKDSHGQIAVSGADEQAHALSSRQWIAAEKRLESDTEYVSRVSRDLAASKSDIERKLGILPIAFAYPFGDFGQESANDPTSASVLSGILRKLFPITFYQTRGSEFLNNYPGDPFMSRRIDMKSELGVSADRSADNLIGLLDDNREKWIGYMDDFSQDNGWLRGWGALSIKENRMTLGDSQTDDSSMAFLGGTYLWKDYSMKVKASAQNGAAFALLARYVSEHDYAACDFASDHVSVVGRVGGRDVLDRSIPRRTYFGTGRTAEVGIAVFGGWIGCYLDGKLAVSGTVDGLANGGIGFKMWDTDRKGGSVSVSSLDVSDVDPRSTGHQ